ncbi:nuclear transport factor 2 family protein [uncultured Shewanella sp.]|uniref:nuclear transport factor 2 family protein n=1 Tax=uncultured Shewanella sp. TaxID=173975 RepID=UPI00260F19B8|nr:nuclear transport factor 2 family protein [uncultured Shewanella sp.]
MADPLWLKAFVELYNRLGTDNLGLIKQVYHSDVHFTDPMHTVKGVDNLLHYFERMYQNIISCQFQIEHTFYQKHEAAIYWSMIFCHKKLNGKRPITIQGHSHLKAQDEQVIFHRDYLDLGAMIYEHIPVLGHVITHIKHRASQS